MFYHWENLKTLKILFRYRIQLDLGDLLIFQFLCRDKINLVKWIIKRKINIRRRNCLGVGCNVLNLLLENNNQLKYENLPILKYLVENLSIKILNEFCVKKKKILMN